MCLRGDAAFLRLTLSEKTDLLKGKTLGRPGKWECRCALWVCVCSGRGECTGAIEPRRSVFDRESVIRNRLQGATDSLLRAQRSWSCRLDREDDFEGDCLHLVERLEVCAEESSSYGHVVVEDFTQVFIKRCSSRCPVA